MCASVIQYSLADVIGPKSEVSEKRKQKFSKKMNRLLYL